jgi:hypothetical protein
MRIPCIASCAALVVAAAARADTVDVTSTTLLNVQQQTRGGLPGESPDLVTVAPAFEILSIAARSISNPVADDLQIVLGTWGSYEIQDRRWDNGTGSNLTGDVMTGYVSGRFLSRMLTLRAGREHVAAGVGRMIQLDGGEAVLAVPFGFRLSGYVGLPVAQRFASRSGIQSWNPVGGDLAYGGRAGWSLALSGTPGRGFDFGVSANRVLDGGDVVREEAGADLRLQPYGNLTLSGFGAYSLHEERLSEATARLRWSVTRDLDVDVDWRFVSPDLLLSRQSILSVFSDEERNYYGAGFTYELLHGLLVGVNYHLQREPETDESDVNGHELEGRLEWELGRSLVGIEGFYVDSVENGYVAGRLFGRTDLGPFFAALDVLAHAFREEINGEKTAVTGTLTAGMNLSQRFSAVVAGRAGVTPFLEQTFEVMAKLAYNQTYRTQEVR